MKKHFMKDIRSYLKTVQIYDFLVLQFMIIKANFDMTRKDELMSNLLIKKNLKAIQTALKWCNLLKNRINIKKLKDTKKNSHCINSGPIKITPINHNFSIEVKDTSQEIMKEAKENTNIINLKEIRTKKRQIPKNYDNY